MVTSTRTTQAQTTTAPLRGTQSLVGVMGFVWKRPSLPLIEVGWRWLAMLPVLVLLWHGLRQPWSRLPLDSNALGSMTFLEPVRSAAVLARQLRRYLPAVGRLLRWLLPGALCWWALLAGAGRTWVVRRAERRLHGPAWPMMLSALVRAAAFCLLLFLWGASLFAAVRTTVIVPGRLGAEPNLVLLTAEAIAATLAAFLLWSTLVWQLDLLPLRLLGARPQGAARQRELRSKLIETNLVMGIVRVALLVLAMTFSASPLPFESQQTQAFIEAWWAGVGLLYLLASDFFHVVRRLAYLRLLEAMSPPG